MKIDYPPILKWIRQLDFAGHKVKTYMRCQKCITLQNAQFLPKNLIFATFVNVCPFFLVVGVDVKTRKSSN